MIGILGFIEREEQSDVLRDWDYILDNIKSLLLTLSQKSNSLENDNSRPNSFVMSLFSVIASIAQSSHQNRYLLAFVWYFSITALMSRYDNVEHCADILSSSWKIDSCCESVSAACFGLQALNLGISKVSLL